MGNINLKIVTLSGIIMDSDFDHVIIPGVDGDFGIYEEHTPFITKIRPGSLMLYKGQKLKKFAIHDGFVTVEDNVITILSEVIEEESKINKTRAQKSKKRAEKRLASSSDDINFRRAEASLKRALARLNI